MAEAKSSEFIKSIGWAFGALLFIIVNILAGILLVFKTAADYLAKATKNKPKKKEPEIKEAV